jgi:isopenicillin N synthase-like dioxygenase
MLANPVQRVHDANPIDNPAALPAVTAASSAALDQLLQQGFAKLKITGDIRRQIDQTFATSTAFYARPLAEKRSFALGQYVEGYRDIGLEYSQQPDRPDLTESFSLWNRNRRHTDAAGWPERCALHAEMRTTIDALAVPVANLFQAMANRWAPGSAGPRFFKASYLQVNYYEPAQHTRDMLQDGHEDGHLITVVTATGPGLEIKLGDAYVPVELEDDEMLIMPGSLLALMTGHEIPPLFHQVRNSYRKEPRLSLMFFVNPETNQPLEPWVRNETNRHADIIAEANALPLKFGLPTLADGTEGRG